VTEEHFEQALQPSGEAVQNLVQQAHAGAGKVPQAEQGNREIAGICDPLQCYTDVVGILLTPPTAICCGSPRWLRFRPPVLGKALVRLVLLVARGGRRAYPESEISGD